MADNFSGAALLQRLKTYEIPAKRGRILANDGSLLVANARAYLLYAEPKNIKDKNSVQLRLSQLLSVPIASVSSKFINDDLSWIPVLHQVTEDTKQKIMSEKIPGIGFEEESLRYYPESSMAAHVLGFVGKDGKGDPKGYFGLEGYYNLQLAGRKGLVKQEADARGLPILIGNQRRIEPEDGRELTLWIDKSIQYIAEAKLKDAIEKYGAKGGSVILMDPKTGAILAIASYPNYDPTNYGEFDSSVYKNPVIAQSYEPGSTFKVLVMSGAINDKKVKPSTEFSEDGPIEIGGFAIRTWNNKYAGTTTATGILERSSNVGMVKIGELLGRDRLIHYINSYGIGEPTGIDLEEEVSPALRPLNSWYDIDYATATFGQGIAVTALQMVRAVGALANDGKLMEPHIVKTIVDLKGKRFTIEPKQVRQVVSGDTARVVAEMMVSAVDNGEARFAKPKGYRIAGKTGTAQIPIAGHYDGSKTIASFVGFAPVPNPRFVMLTTIQEPTTSPWGSETAAPLFFAVAKELFNYYGIAPSE